MPIQEFNIYTKKGYAGELVDSGPRVTQTGILTDATLGFGLGLSRDLTIERGVRLNIAADDGNVWGISMREYNHEAGARPAVPGTDWEYLITESVSVMREGYIYLLVETTAATAESLANIDDVTGGFVGGVPVAGNKATTNVTFVQSGAVGDIVKARIDIIAV